MAGWLHRENQKRLCRRASAFHRSQPWRIKEELGDLIDDKDMENKGARENAAGKNRQEKNDAV